MKVQFPNERPEYRAARDALLTAEIELRRAMEIVAEKRRQLPAGGRVPEDYSFVGELSDGSVGNVRLSELFGSHRSLAIYNMMFPRSRSDDRPGPITGATASLPLAEGPCPSCVALLDQLDGAGTHLAQRMAFAVVAKTSAERLLTFGHERGWRNLRLLSSANNTYNQDYFGESDSGAQQPMLNVFERHGMDVRHLCASELLYGPADPGQDMRHLGTLEPLWNILDMTREGRGVGWDEQLAYPYCSPVASAVETT